MTRSKLAAAAALLLLSAACGRPPEKSASAPAPTPTAVPRRAEPPVDAQDVTARQRRPPGGRTPVIWLGLDGLDWELLDRLSREGKMPHWQRLTSEGYSARLRAYLPVLSPIIWTTLATGVGPDVHRVLDFQEVDPASGQKVPISGRSRAVPAIWNVASASGVSVGVVGWWGSHPAEEVSGFFVSDHASPILFEGLPRQGLAYPASLSAGVEQIVAREGEVSDAELARYVNVSAEEIARARASGEGLQNPIIALSRTIGATRIESRIARELYDRNLPDLMMLYLEGTDVVGHIFATDVPPKLACVSDEDFARYRNAVDEYYALVDRILGQWMRRAEEDGATLVVNSDHGFKWGADRSCVRDSLNPSTAGFWHRLDGVFAAWGKRVKRSSERGDASVFDVAPTVSALLSLPVERRASGRVIKAAFPDLSAPPKRDLSAIPVRRLSTEPLSEKEADEYMQKLRALGYLSGGEPGKLAPSGGDRPGMTEGAWNNLGVYLSVNADRNDLPAAEAAYKQALALRPDYHSPQFNLAMLYRRTGKDETAIDWLFRSLDTGHADPTGTVLEWSSHYASEGKPKPQKEVLERAVRKYPQEEAIARPLAILLFQGKDCAAAEAAVAPFAAATRDPDTLNILGLLNTCLGRPNEAIGFFQRSLAVKPDQPGAIRSLDLLQKGLPSDQKQP